MAGMAAAAADAAPSHLHWLHAHAQPQHAGSCTWLARCAAAPGEGGRRSGRGRESGAEMATSHIVWSPGSEGSHFALHAGTDLKLFSAAAYDAHVHRATACWTQPAASSPDGRCVCTHALATLRRLRHLYCCAAAAAAALLFLPPALCLPRQLVIVVLTARLCRPQSAPTSIPGPPRTAPPASHWWGSTLSSATRAPWPGKSQRPHPSNVVAPEGTHAIISHTHGLLWRAFNCDVGDRTHIT
jgi:hypothetical protein